MKWLISFAENLFFLRSSSSFSLFELIKEISTPEKSADANSAIMTTIQLLIFVYLKSCSDAENLAPAEVLVGSHAVAENQLVGTGNLHQAACI